MRFSNYKILPWAIAMVVLLAGIILFISIRQSRHLKDTGKLISHTQQVIISIQKVVLSELDYETGLRRYLITGNDQFLSSQEQSELDGMNAIKIVRELTSDNKIQQALCDSLSVYFDKRIGYSRRIVALRRAKGLEAVTGTELNGEGKSYSDKIRNVGTMMQNEENRLLEIRKNTNERSFSTLNIILFSTLAAGFILSIVIIQNIRSKSIKQKLNEEKFKALLNAAPDATVIVNEKGVIAMVNQQTLSLFGYSHEEMVGMPVEILIPAELRGKHEHHRADFIKAPRVRAMGAGIDLYAVKKNGEKFPVEISLSPVKTNEGMLVSTSLRDITSRKKEEEKLKIAKKDFQLLVSSVKDYAIFLLDKKGRVASWNTGAEYIKGYTAEEIIGQPMDVFYTEEEKEQGKPQKNLQMTLQLGHYETEGWRVRKDGSIFFADVVFTSLVDDKGDLYGYAKVTRDISEKRKAEERLRFLASIADNIQEPVISTDNNQNITRWNKPAEVLLEWKSEEVIGKNITELLQTNYVDEGTDLIFEFLKAEKNSWQGEVIYHTRSGRLINVLMTASHLKDAEANVTGNLILVRDITLRKKAENELSNLNLELEQRVKERTEAVLQTMEEKNIILESIGDAFFAVDKNWTVTYWNRIAETALDVRKQEIVGKDLWAIFSDSIDSISYKKYHEALATIQVVHFEDYYPALNKWYEISAYPSANGLSVYFKDITERKEATREINKLNLELEERVLIRTEQLKKSTEEMEAFSYSVSHDLRAPLRGIIGFANILEEDYANKLDDEARRITTIIKKNTTKMGLLIDDLLSFSRMGRQELMKSNLDSNKIVGEIITDLGLNGNHKKIEWVIHSLPFIKADLKTINQVWINLISNAIKYSRNAAHPKIEIGSIEEKKSVTFFVKDNGVGFDEKYKEKLFKVFQRLHTSEEFEGTGIGLAIVDKVVSKHGGTVWAEAEVNKGACFYFSLPLSIDEESQIYIKQYHQ